MKKIFYIGAIASIFFGCKTDLATPEPESSDVPLTNDLIISEVRVTSSSEDGGYRNTYFEVYNGTESEVDLSNYSVRYASNGNGGSYDPSKELVFSGTIEHGTVIIIARTNTDPSIIVDPDYEWSDLTANGNDPIGLFKEGTLIDQYGEPHSGGSGEPVWDVAGVSEAAADHVLIRKFAVEEGNLDWDNSRGTNTDDSEWLVNDANYYQNMGKPTPKP